MFKWLLAAILILPIAYNITHDQLSFQSNPSQWDSLAFATVTFLWAAGGGSLAIAVLMMFFKKKKKRSSW